MAVDFGVGTFGLAHIAGWVPHITNQPPLFDPLTTTAMTLQRMLNAGAITSVQILNIYYRQILEYNAYLKAVYQLAPNALERAAELDRLRSNGVLLGMLHGIPVLLKDNIGTEPSLGMNTTACTPALVRSIATNNSPVVDRLIAAGVIIMGKVTLSEMMWYKGLGVRVGWSSLCGQAQNPYIEGGIDKSDGISGHSSPGGSSSGPAIAVAAGFAPLAVGTETEGSINCPATRNSLYAVKPTLGVVPNKGIVPISFHLDTAGPMAKSAEDIASLLTVMIGNDRPDASFGGYITFLKGADGWNDLRVGLLDPDKWRYDKRLQTPAPVAIQQIRNATWEAYSRIASLARSCRMNVPLRPDEDFDFEGSNGIIELMITDFAPDFDKYLKGTIGSNVRDTEELLAWNAQHSNLVLPPEYPSQESIEQAVAFDKSSDRRGRILAHISEVGKSLPDTLDKYDIDVIIGPADSWITKYSAATGHPHCSLPTGYIEYNGRPVGLTAIARSEATLITLMSAHEASFPQRRPPSAFLAHRSYCGD
ncbi:amidase family protein [Polyplosphaeria fusca]|uniref:Amidase family protein n=1 Tax=Polyplosphaeria fusca TaxID=682080 RepID=A0A9P4UWG1_9PLEO|nr:amidase family protein [Polyplosphaeria fusca]